MFCFTLGNCFAEDSVIELIVGLKLEYLQYLNLSNSYTNKENNYLGKSGLQIIWENKWPRLTTLLLCNTVLNQLIIKLQQKNLKTF